MPLFRISLNFPPKTEMATAAGGSNNFTEVAEEYPITIVTKVKSKLGILFLTKEVSLISSKIYMSLNIYLDAT